jgi:hypothetical protein
VLLPLKRFHNEAARDVPGCAINAFREGTFEKCDEVECPGIDVSIVFFYL